MLLKSLSLFNYKNIESAALEFSPKANCLLGNNGMGKSNLLDAIYFLSYTKSFTGASDQLAIRRGEDFAMLSGKYLRRGLDETLDIGLTRGQRKTLKRTGKPYARLSEHIGVFPLVMVAPADMGIITDGPEARRRLIDMIISQGDPVYLDHLIRYEQQLRQRNALLRAEAEPDAALFEAVEVGLHHSGHAIHQRRQQEIAKLGEIFQRYYHAIAPDEGCVGLDYESHLNAEGAQLCDLLAQTRARDRIITYTTRGVHRDDLVLTINGMPARQSASQGQAKTFTIALRLAQYEFLAQCVGFKPLLLLDDIFDKLDAQRVASIMSIVAQPQFGQIFITDTNRRHLDEIMSMLGGDYRLWSVDHGRYTPLEEGGGHAPR